MPPQYSFSLFFWFKISKFSLVYLLKYRYLGPLNLKYLLGDQFLYFLRHLWTAGSKLSLNIALWLHPPDFPPTTLRSLWFGYSNYWNPVNFRSPLHSAPPPNIYYILSLHFQLRNFLRWADYLSFMELLFRSGSRNHRLLLPSSYFFSWPLADGLP